MYYDNGVLKILNTEPSYEGVLSLEIGVPAVPNNTHIKIKKSSPYISKNRIMKVKDRKRGNLLKSNETQVRKSKDIS